MAATLVQLLGLVLLVVAGAAVSMPAGLAALAAVLVYVGVAMDRQSGGS